MPELPEVETVVRMLAPLVGRVITDVTVLHKPTVSGSPAKLFRAKGHRIERVWRGTLKALDELKSLKKLGPEPFDIAPADFAARLRARKSRLKALLLNQE